MPDRSGQMALPYAAAIGFVNLPHTRGGVSFQVV